MVGGIGAHKVKALGPWWDKQVTYDASPQNTHPSCTEGWTPFTGGVKRDQQHWEFLLCHLGSQHMVWCRRWIGQALKVASFSRFEPLSTSRHHLTQRPAEIIAQAVTLTVPPHVRGDEIPLSRPTRAGALGYAPEMRNSQFVSPNFHWRHLTSHP